MRVAVISDIHGNHYALQKVLLVAKQNNIDKLLVLGDIVGYYYYPSEVLLQQVLNGEIKMSYLTQKYGNGIHSSNVISLIPLVKIMSSHEDPSFCIHLWDSCLGFSS